MRHVGVERALKPGETLFHAGSRTVGLYEIIEGKVRLVHVNHSGHEAVLQVAGPGDTLAEASLFSSTYHCDAIASTAATVRLYPRADQRITAKPEIRSGICCDARATSDDVADAS